MAPDGQPGVDQAPAEGALAGAVVSERARSAVGSECPLRSSAPAAVVKQALGYAGPCSSGAAGLPGTFKVLSGKRLK